MEYDAALSAYTSKPQMENSDFAISARPDSSILYGIECKDQPLNGRYVRGSGSLTNQPINLTDIGTMYIGSQNTTIAAGTSLGELWVTYDIELRKPHISPSRWGFYTNAGITGTSTSVMVGIAGTQIAQGSLTGAYTVGPNMYFPNANIGDTYMMSYTDFYGANSTITSLPTLLFTGFTTFICLNGNTYNTIQAPGQTGAISNSFITTYYVTVSNVSTVPTVNVASGGVGSNTTHAFNWTIVNLGNGLTAASF
jgi:hypothetical protein